MSERTELQNMKSVLIIGANGFLGRNIREGLSDYILTCPTRQEMNLLDEKSVKSFLSGQSFDIVIYSATSYNTGHIYAENLNMFLNVLHNVKCTKMIVLGSWAEYDRRHWRAGLREEDFGEYLPVDEYGSSKYVIAKWCEEHDWIYNLRLFGMIGKYESPAVRLIPDVYGQMKSGDTIEVKKNQRMDLLYAGDLVRIVRWFIENDGKYRVYNVCTGRDWEYLDIVKRIVLRSRRKFYIIYNGNDQVESRYGDNTRLLTELGGFDFTDFDTALDITHDWFVGKGKTK